MFPKWIQCFLISLVPLLLLCKDGIQLPFGPVITTGDRTVLAFHREVILKRPDIFKIAVLRQICSTFGQRDFPSISLLSSEMKSEIEQEMEDQDQYEKQMLLESSPDHDPEKCQSISIVDKEITESVEAEAKTGFFLQYKNRVYTL